jgi:hypothetical protein
MPTRVTLSARGAVTVLVLWRGQIGMLGGLKEALDANRRVS